jgi:metal-dependent amidase/aminoacylase/carboxypeptidase family protein
MTSDKSQVEGKPDLDAITEAHRPNLSQFEEIYKDIHNHPELGTHESRTSEIVSKHLKSLGSRSRTRSEAMV